jgi:hypothetical protein
MGSGSGFLLLSRRVEVSQDDRREDNGVLTWPLTNRLDVELATSYAMKNPVSRHKQLQK